jgi:ribokinase
MATGKVIVAGSINMDVVANAARLPRIGETVAGTTLSFHPGGKGANQAVAAARLGAPTVLVGRVGDDAFGRALVEFLAAAAIDLTHVRALSDVPTGTAMITIVDADNAIVVVPGANARLAPADIAGVSAARGDVLVSQFEIPLATIAAFFAPAAAVGARTILNPAPAQSCDALLLGLADILVLNETELGFLTGRALGEADPPDRFIEATRSLRVRRDQVICVTLGRRGAVALIADEVLSVPGHAVEAIDTTGAGDCFVGALAAQLAAGAGIADALAYANAAAAICVTRRGAGPSMPNAAEVDAVRRPARRLP